MAYFLFLDNGIELPLNNQDEDDEEIVVLEAISRCEAAGFGGAIFEGEVGRARVLGVVQFTVSYETYMGFVPRGNAS